MQEHEQAIAMNRQSWDDRVPVHLASEMYRRYLATLRSGGESFNALDRVIVEEVGDVGGKSLLQLQCHIGHETLAWARRGARATGLDFSPRAIEAARHLTKELAIDARFVCANVYDAPAVIEERFDVVVATIGVFAWVPDLRWWMRIAGSMLKPGGMLYVLDEHPITHMLGERPCVLDDLCILESYFNRGPHPCGPGPSYAKDPSDPARPVGGSVQWTHTVADFINAVVDAGLRIEALHEHPLCACRQFAMMHEDADGVWRLPGDLRDKLPMVMSIRAQVA